jgi:hypothetical protein
MHDFVGKSLRDIHLDEKEVGRIRIKLNMKWVQDVKNWVRIASNDCLWHCRLLTFGLCSQKINRIYIVLNDVLYVNGDAGLKQSWPIVSFCRIIRPKFTETIKKTTVESFGFWTCPLSGILNN